MKPDALFGEVKTDKPETTMLEINDSNREHETKAGDKYAHLFIGFLESLGYKVDTKASHWIKDIAINGVKLEIDLNNASYMAKSAYTRTMAIRKETNRFIALTTGFYNTPAIVRVYFNKEMQVDKLRRKINQAITERIAREKGHEDFTAKRQENIMTIGNHFFSNPIIKANVKSLYLNAGTLCFHLKSGHTIVNIKVDGSFVSALFLPAAMNSTIELMAFTNDASSLVKALDLTARAILAMPILPAEIVEFSEKERDQYFYSETMSTEWRVPEEATNE